MSESTPLLVSPPASEVNESYPIHKRLAGRMESAQWHWVVITLTSLDALFVILDVGWDFLKPEGCVCDDSCPRDPDIFEVFKYISIAITALFLTEIPMALYAFGRKYYWSVEHAYLHIFDAVVISTTFVLEVFLAGREAEIAGLLVLLRLWRVVKLISTVSVGVTEYNDVEESPKKLEREAWEKEKAALLAELDKVKAEVEGMRGILGGTSGSA